MSENKHLTLDERNFIEQELAKNTSFREIAKFLSKDPTTISKEVKKHRIRKEGQSVHVNYNHCAKKYNCHRHNLCNSQCLKECRHCNTCNSVCSDFVDGTCFKLNHAPYVCNGCTEKFGCKLTKYYYRALPSFNSYKTLLTEARQGINLTELELSNLDRIVSPLIKKGQSISHIILTDNGTEFGDPLSLEFNNEGIGRTRIFYCNPRASYQKGMLEKNHEFIRYVLPKGTPFEGLLQTDINLMINHINSFARASLNWFAPIDVAKFTLDKNVIKKLNLKKIPPNEIQLNQKLLKKN